MRLAALVVFALLAAGPAASGQVVITEVSADPVFVELLNAGAEPVALKGYRLTGDVTHVFVLDQQLAPGQALVVALDADRFTAAFPDAPRPYAVPLRNRVSKNGGELQLHDPALRRTDRVRYGEAKRGRTWQRRSATTEYRGPANWRRAAPTPGRFAPEALPAGPLLDAPRREPLQPRAKQPITVSVRVHGPVREVAAVWRTRRGQGRAPLRPAAGDPARYVGRLPAQPDLTLVTYRFEATGPTGAVRALKRPWRGEPLRTLIAQPPPSVSVPLIHLELPPEALQELKHPGRARLPATFAWFHDGRAAFADGVTLQVRGGSWTRSWNKTGWTLRFPRGHPYRGRRRVVLRSCWRDLTYLRDVLGLELFRAAGVPAPAARGVRVYVNGELYGLYLELEDVDEAFLNAHGLGGAVLYKAEEPYTLAAAQAGDLADGRRFPGRAMYRARYSKRTATGEPYADLQTFVEGYLGCPEERLAAWFAEHFEVERYVRYLAVCALITHWDSVIKNYFWARDREGDGKWQVLPWDLDLTFGDFRKRLDATAPVLLGTRGEPIRRQGQVAWDRLRDRFLQVADHRRRLYRKILELTETVFREQPLDQRIDAWIARHRRWIEADRARWGVLGRDERLYSYSPALLAREVSHLKLYVKERRAFLRDACARSLAEEGPGTPATPGALPPVGETLDARRRGRAEAELLVLLLGVIGLVVYLRSGGLRARP